MNRLNVILAAALCGVLGCEGRATFQRTEPPEGGSTVTEGEAWAPIVDSLSCGPVQGAGPFQTTCAFAVTAGTPSVCELSLPTGVLSRDRFEDCATGELTVLLPSVGAHTLTVTVTDLDGLHTQAEVALVADNVAPAIIRFEPQRHRGTAPVTTGFELEVSDTNFDTLTCALLLDGAATPTETFVPCQSHASQSFTFPQGVHTAKLRVEDGRGGVAEKDVTLESVPPVGDVRVVAVEFGQSVIKENLKLVEGKDALLRVIAVSDTPGLASTGRVSLIQGGAVADTRPLSTPTTVPTVEQRNSLAATFNATVPASWVAPGMTLRVELDPADFLPETDELNNVRELTPVVGKGTVLRITGVPVEHQGMTATVPAFEDTLLGHFPLKTVQRTVRAPYVFTGDFTNAYSGWNDLLSQISALRFADGSTDYYFGFIRNGGGGIAGLGFLGSPIAVGLDYYGHVVPHELGHNFGLPHAPCGPVSQVDSNYPYAGGEIGTFGIDLDFQQLIPATMKDLMSYCHPSWISDYNYAKTQNFLEAYASAAPSQASATSSLLLSGWIDAEGEIHVRPLHRIHARPGPPQDGSIQARLHTDADVVEVPLSVQHVADGELRHFTAVIPDPGPIERLELLDGKTFYAQDARFAAVPGSALAVHETAQTLRVTWDAASGKTAAVAWLGDGERITIGLWLEGGDVHLPISELPSGGQFEISLSGGLSPVRHVVTRR